MYPLPLGTRILHHHGSALVPGNRLDLIVSGTRGRKLRRGSISPSMDRERQCADLRAQGTDRGGGGMIGHRCAFRSGNNGQVPESELLQILAETGREGYPERSLGLALADGDPVAVDVIPPHFQQVADSLSGSNRKLHDRPRHAANGRGGKSTKSAKANATKPSREEILEFYARCVNGDGFLPQMGISTSIRHEMLVRGLVTEERLRARGA